MKPHLNYRLKDGDTVIFTEPVRIDRYTYCPASAPSGCWTAGHVLKGVQGTVVKARTPCVTRSASEPAYFANVDVLIAGHTFRVRPFHHQLRRTK